MNEDIQSGAAFDCPLPLSDNTLVQLAHGSGGRLSYELVQRVIGPAFDQTGLETEEDAANLLIGDQQMVVTTDSFVVSPLFFPGGNIGDLAVNGTVNDLCMRGAVPRFLTVGLIVEEGLSLSILQQILSTMGQAACKAGVAIVCGDTKVVEKGKGDGLFINTTGIGIVRSGVDLSVRRIRPGDKLLVSGTLGDHGIAVLSQREGFSFGVEVVSDTAPLVELTTAILAAGGEAVHALRDPTRGGLAAVCHEFSRSAGVEIELQADWIPVKGAVKSACELLGLDPLYVANEGKLVAAVAPERVEAVLAAMRSQDLGRDAAIIGEVGEGKPGRVTLCTALGAKRLLDWPPSELLPRIC